MQAPSDTLSSVADAWRDAHDDFDSAALRVFAAQRAAVPAYAAWCAHELGTRANPSVASWRDVPALPIAAFKQLDVFEPGSPTAAEWESSGTTSVDRSRHRLQETTQYEDALTAGVRAALVPDIVTGRRAPLACVQLQPSAADAPTSSLTHMYDHIRGDERICVDAGVFVDGDYAIDAPGAWQALKRLAREGTPVLLLSTSFALAMLIDAAEAAGWEPLRLPEGSRVVDTGGFKGRTREMTRDELLARIALWLWVPAAWCENEYGMSELSSQAWLGCVAEAAGTPLPLPAPGARWTPPWLRVRVVDPVTLAQVDDGEQGLLVFHDLANVWSCAAIRSEDLGIRRGDGFELVGRAPGAALKGCSLRLEDVADAAH
ncbi:MAG: long-chain fatty acid--CoA ligase [Thermoleophilia bacterium]|nr:long-chain fatty acid--CoA ligase [Thermoleophilia bacterium]